MIKKITSHKHHLLLLTEMKWKVLHWLANNDWGNKTDRMGHGFGRKSVTKKLGHDVDNDCQGDATASQDIENKSCMALNRGNERH